MKEVELVLPSFRCQFVENMSSEDVPAQTRATTESLNYF